jgi:3-oxoacyl-[acyl-carrier-protein] synthase-1
MVTALGYTAAASCAAARAGILRLRELEGAAVRDPATGESEAVTGHFVRGYTDGFVGLGRLARLGTGALTDLIETSPAIDWRRTGLFLTTTSDLYLRERARVAPLEEDVPDGPDSDELGRRRELVLERLGPLLARAAGIPLRADLQRVVTGDGCGLLELLDLVDQQLREGRIGRAVVGSADSLVGPEIVPVLDHFGVLKTAARPVGFLPGEAAAMLLVEPGEDVRPGDVTLEGGALAHEPTSRLEDRAPTGRALHSAVTAVLHSLPEAGRDVRLVVGGLNGDAHRALDWGNALPRLRHAGLPDAVTHRLPAAAFGELGAASSAAAVCLAISALRGGWADGDTALLWFSDDAGPRGALCVRAH